ncbi:hypothetical protein [Paenibacillus hamazuiensis]|uniref:hypothetical protein n=1 Tax=Paenibacillus hamazuiensis TaxID=2936508 RepID=UPI00200FED31|nr:hypothetical protein [Paenibacillus hamazuiensis]
MAKSVVRSGAKKRRTRYPQPSPPFFPDPAKMVRLRQNDSLTDNIRQPELPAFSFDDLMKQMDQMLSMMNRVQKLYGSFRQFEPAMQWIGRFLFPGGGQK